LESQSFVVIRSVTVICIYYSCNLTTKYYPSKYSVRYI